MYFYYLFKYIFLIHNIKICVTRVQRARHAIHSMAGPIRETGFFVLFFSIGLDLDRREGLPVVPEDNVRLRRAYIEIATRRYQSLRKRVRKQYSGQYSNPFFLFFLSYCN